MMTKKMTKKMLSVVVLMGVLAGQVLTAAQEPYYLPNGVDYDSSIPSPSAFLGYPIGELHTRHDRLVSYLQLLADNSPRASFRIIGQTHEMRPLMLLTLTSPENLERIEEIRQAHLASIDPSHPRSADRPVVLYLGYGVHGNEASSAEAALLAAYYYAAARSPEVEGLLARAVILIDPVYNPDGRERHTHWVNMHKGFHPSADPMDREHNEGWPNGRTNHYWFDLNRDWLPGSQVESQGRLETFHRWMPNVVADYHEMGTNSTYFFEPTHSNNQNPHVPQPTYSLTARFAERWSQAMSGIGSLFYTKENYDDFYPGYGSSYPDLQGGIGLLFEQARSGGNRQESAHGELTFAFAIRNHVTTSLATVETAVELRSQLFDLQRDFFASALDLQVEGASAYVFGDPRDRGRNEAFLNLLSRHRIEHFPLSRSLTVEGRQFDPGRAWVVPRRQRQRRMVDSIFETRIDFPDAIFYDTSAWSMAYAYGLPHAALNDDALASGLAGGAGSAPDADWFLPEKASYAYLFEWDDYRAPALLNALLVEGVRVKTAFKPFQIVTNRGSRRFHRGSMLVPVGIQESDPDQLLSWIREASIKQRIPVFGVGNGLSLEGADLGSGEFQIVPPPEVLLLVGEGVSNYEAGEIWHLLDTRVGMTITKADVSDFSRLSLDRYNTLVLASGNYGSLSSDSLQEIKRWISRGGTLVTVGRASAWAIRQEIAKAKIVEESQEASQIRHDYEKSDEVEGAKRIGGAIFRTDLDITHPLGFGYRDRALAVYRNSDLMVEASENPYNTVAQYVDSALISGYVSQDNLKRLAGTASLLVSQSGSGRTILFVDNPNFRGFWYGTNRLFLNAVFLGRLERAPRS